MNTQASGPLKGVKVIDLSRFIAGPYCTLQLAQLGADVIKVEKLGSGDDVRGYEPRHSDESLYFLTFNANKRSVELNFRDADDIESLRTMIAGADVLVENFRAGTLEAMGLDPVDLLAANPRLVITRVSGYGQDGPLADQPCFDAVAQASSGMMSIAGDPDGPPRLTGSYLIDYAAGMQAAIATLAAVLHSRATGEGQVVDVALLDTAYGLLLSGPMEDEIFDEPMARIGNNDRYVSPGGTFRTGDGWVHLVAGKDSHFRSLCTAMGKLELVENPLFSSGENRIANRTEIHHEVEAWTLTLPTDEIVRLLSEQAVPVAAVVDVPTASRNPQLIHRGHRAKVQHPTGGEFSVPGIIPKLSRTPGRVYAAPPLLGQHTREVAEEFSVSLSATQKGAQA
jgi:crotonobetainyl-CoA:carnitine CoA-transferase CaiB-like acyl-CoA transferase